jgi:hypothetical protein
LEHPGIWDYDYLAEGGQYDPSEALGEQYLLQNVFTSKTVN